MIPKLSIIIPVYQVEAYVKETLASVFATSAPTDSFEVIVVNDGTKDRSMDVVRLFADQPNLTILEQENQGLSIARMKGLSIATGEYVWFIDSDDWLVEDGVGRVIRMLEEHPSADLLVFPIIRTFVDSSMDRVYPEWTEELSLSGKEYIRRDWTPTPAIRFVLRRQLFENRWLFFPKGLLHEDMYWGPVLLYLSARVYVMMQPVYHYRQRKDSIMHTVSMRSSYDLVSDHRLLMDFLEDFVTPEDQEFFRQFCFRSLKWGYTINSCYYGMREFRRFVRHNGFYVWKEWNQAFPNVSWRRKVRRLTFCKAPKLYRSIWGSSAI